MDSSDLKIPFGFIPIFKCFEISNGAAHSVNCLRGKIGNFLIEICYTGSNLKKPVRTSKLYNFIVFSDGAGRNFS